MTVTYTDDRMRNTSATADTFVPRYARAKRARKGVRTWMILAPIGAVVLIGGGAAMMMSSGETQALVEPAPTATALQPFEAVAAPLERSVAPSTLAVNAAEPAATPAPVVREAARARAPTVQRRVVPVERTPAAAPAVTPREVVEPTGPRPYTADTATVAPPAAAPATPVPAPVIQTAPLT